jgi:signal transduction histidine kinase
MVEEVFRWDTSRVATRRTLYVLAHATFAVTMVAEAASIPLGMGLQPAADTWLYALFALVQGLAGLAILRRHPGHPIGWLFLLATLVSSVMGDLGLAYGLRAQERGWPHGDLPMVLGLTAWLAGAVALPLTLLLFPDGRLPGRRWRLAVVPVLLGPAIAFPGWSLNPKLGSEFSDGTNPYAVPALPTDALFVTGMTIIALGLVLGAVAVVWRLRRSSGEVHQQLKWFAFAAAVAAVILPLSGVFWLTSPLAHVAAELAGMGVPAAAGVAILRYRLYDIDLVINRTLVYGSLTVVLGLSYAAVAILLGTSLGRGSAWVTAAATLVVALAFRPVRARIQDVVDRRFDRRRWDAVHRMDGFLERLAAGRAEPEDVVPLLRSLVGDDTLELAGRTPDVRHGHLAPEQSALLNELLSRGTLAVEMVGLRSELRLQLAEVEESRARIVQAGDRERRRIERDLHDGAQQRLVSIGLALRHAQHQLATGTGQVDQTLEASIAEIGETIDELRQLTHGLPPAQLDAGLAPAFHELARRSPVPVEVAVVRERFDRGVEAAAYFVGCEALTNAVKHAGATHIDLRAQRSNGSLVVQVNDDGAGGADPRSGTGLRGLADRVSAVGGTLTIASRPGGGTQLTAELPCGS